MKILGIALGLAGVVFLARCTDEELTSEEVKRLLLEEKAYPAVVEYKIFCGSENDAERLHALGLADDSLVVAQLAHTTGDVGKPLISFTEKAKPYLVATSDTLRAIDVQKVKIADEQLDDIVNITISQDRKNAAVGYTTHLENFTPFRVLLQNRLQQKQRRTTYFIFQNGRWRWTGKIVKMP